MPPTMVLLASLIGGGALALFYVHLSGKRRYEDETFLLLCLLEESRTQDELLAAFNEWISQSDLVRFFDRFHHLVKLGLIESSRTERLAAFIRLGHKVVCSLTDKGRQEAEKRKRAKEQKEGVSDDS